MLRPVIGKVLQPYVPDPAKMVGRRGTALVDGTVCPVWDWDAIPDLYSGKAKCTGMNVQIACNLKGDVAAIGPVPLHGARHDACAFEASGLKAVLEKSLGPDSTGADLEGYSEPRSRLVNQAVGNCYQTDILRPVRLNYNGFSTH